MTEPSKVIHVRNVGHEISEVCAWDDFRMLNISQWHTLIQWVLHVLVLFSFRLVIC